VKVSTKNKLLEAWQYCDDNDKSSEFMLAYMQDEANVNFDCVVNFIQRTTLEERQKYLKSLTQ